MKLPTILNRFMRRRLRIKTRIISYAKDRMMQKALKARRQKNKQARASRKAQR